MWYSSCHWGYGCVVWVESERKGGGGVVVGGSMGEYEKWDLYAA
jgi:hypothetical protein